MRFIRISRPQPRPRRNGARPSTRAGGQPTGILGLRLAGACVRPVGCGASPPTRQRPMSMFHETLPSTGNTFSKAGG